MRSLMTVLASVVLLTAGPRAQSNAPAERFTALAVNMGSPWTGSGAAMVEIAVDRWSTEAETERLLDVLRQRGPEHLLDALQDNPRVGFIRVPGNLGYDLHFARRTPEAEGGERIVIATDRYIGFWEARNRPRTIDYPFTLIEMHIDRHGEGEGKLSLATKVTLNKKTNTIELENYGTQPVQLRGIKRQPSR